MHAHNHKTHKHTRRNKQKTHKINKQNTHKINKQNAHKINRQNTHKQQIQYCQKNVPSINKNPFHSSLFLSDHHVRECNIFLSVSFLFSSLFFSCCSTHISLQPQTNWPIMFLSCFAIGIIHTMVLKKQSQVASHG